MIILYNFKLIYKLWIWKLKFKALSYLKLDSHLPKRFLFICFNESPSKLMKNAFYFILKALFVLEIFKLLSWLFVHVEKTAWLERWIDNGLTIKIHILPNISRSKDNQTLKFAQLTEHNKRNIFLRKSCRIWDRETSSRPLFLFQKSFTCGKSKWSAV